MYSRFSIPSNRYIFSSLKYLVFLLIALIFVAINYTTFNILTSNHWSKEHKLISLSATTLPDEATRKEVIFNKKSRTVWIRSKTNRNSTFVHIINAFKNHHYNVIHTNHSVKLDEEKWSVMWSHNYPFTDMRSFIMKLNMIQCINQYPGSGYITNKVSLVTSDFNFIPRAFKIPYDKDKLERYASSNPSTMFVQKSSDHRGIKIQKLENLDLKIQDSFIQEFIHNPLLIDGYKFDIGVYVVITSVNPLRVYMFEGDVLFRFCPEKYFPFSADKPNKYVVGDDYLPTWKVPSLAKFYLKQELGMKGSFDAWLRSTNKDPDAIWNAVRQAIKEIFVAKEASIIKAVNNYPEHLRFFELMRFDFIITDQLKVLLMESNMSPNLSSLHFKQNRLLYEQVMFNVLALAGIANGLCSQSMSQHDSEMRVASKDLVAFPDHCTVQCVDKVTDCQKTDCQLCNVCISPSDRRILTAAFLEHTSRGMSKRLIPAPLELKSLEKPIDTTNISPENTLMAEWYRGKCLQDHTFCS